MNVKSCMSVQLKTALRALERSGRPQLLRIGKLMKEHPFERYQHFVVAPEKPATYRRTPRRTTALKPLDEVPSQRNMETISPCDIAQSQIWAFDHKLERFLVDASETSVWEAAEKMLSNMFDGARAIWFTDIPSIGVLYSPSRECYTDYQKSLVSFCYSNRTLLSTDQPTLHPSFNEEVDGKAVLGDNPTLVFPIFDFQNKVVAVSLVSRDAQFGPDDEQFIAFFQHKFRIFSRWLLNQPVQEPLILDILQLHKIEQLIPALTARLQNFFMCRTAEVWSFDRTKKKLWKYTEHDSTEIPIGDGGIVGEVLESETSLNTNNVKNMEAYNEAVDGSEDEALIAVPVTESSNRYVYATVLRGPQSRPLFNADDEDSLKKMTPFVALALANADAFSAIQTEFNKSMQEREGLAALLEVAEILSGQLDTERLCEIIMEKGRYLTKADRCSLFLVSQKRDHLITSLHKGLKNCIDIPITKGIVGRTVTEAKALNIKDAYDDPSFDSATDLQTGYRTKSILSVPIFNQRGEVMGVTEMINKGDGESFTKWDTNLIQIFNVFCGISLENARLYKESLDMSSQLRSFFGISFSLSKTEDARRVMTDIVRNARRALDARRATVFLVDENGDALSTFIVDGGRMPISLPLGKGIVGHCAKTKEGVISNDAYSDSRFNPGVDQATGFKTVSLCAAPILGTNGNVIGVVEMVNKIHGGFRERDLKLLSSIATFASVTLENARLKDIATLGSVVVEIPQWMTEAERKLSTIPAKLKLTEDEQSSASSLDFCAFDWEGTKLTKLLFYLANKFKILETWGIQNDTFFRFVSAIRQTYNHVPFHNWVHACDVTEYLCYELSTAHIDTVYTGLEILALFVSAICHDANHDGYLNIYNLKAETPLGMLFKDKSVMETHHCSVSIGIISREECNLFASLDQHQAKTVWNWMIELILSTDAAEHFRLVAKANELLDSSQFSMTDPEHRLLSMKLVLKTADISNVSRPFTIADKWNEVLCDEIFKHPASESAPEEKPDRPKLQIGFYNFICLPLYQVMARMFPELIVNLNSVKSNLEVWKSMTDKTN